MKLNRKREKKTSTSNATVDANGNVCEYWVREGERDMVKGGYVGTLCGLSVANSEECNSVQKISRKKRQKRLGAMTGKKEKRKTLPCVLWSDTLQLFWSAPLLLLCGPPTWIYSALCFLPCHPEKHATFCKVLTLKQK